MRFYKRYQTALHHKMTLQPPKRIDGQYHLAIQPPVSSPRLTCDLSGWKVTEEWSAWASEKRAKLIDELVSNVKWFSRPPRRDTIDSLFVPLAGKTMQGVLQIFCDPPSPVEGSAVWVLTGLIMTAAAIKPVWTVADFVAEPDQDKISLFGDGDTIDGSDGHEDGEKEIQFDDIALASPAEAPTRMRNREWEARKFLSKERVREFRLKAQIADRLAAKEEARFYKQYGDLEDDESHFSEYDLTENEEESSDSEQP